MDRKGFELKTFGMPWYLACAIALIAIFGAMTGALSADLAGSFVLMLSIGLICNEIGERIPFWNSYIGGGLVLTFLVSAFLFTYNIIPEKYAEGMTMIMDDADFLSFFIIFLITGSILSLEQETSSSFLCRLYSCNLRRTDRIGSFWNHRRIPVWKKPG